MTRKSNYFLIFFIINYNYLLRIGVIMEHVEERFFLSKTKDLMDDEVLKMQGFEYHNAANLGSKREGFIFVLKAEPAWFKKEEVVLALKNTEEIKGAEREKIIKALRELEEILARGVSFFD